MQKQKKYKWEETNLALFGSDIEKKIKEASAQGEDAWKGVGEAPELRVWRIEKFKVVAWPKKKYGQFYDGDSYIVLHTYKKNPNSDALAFDIFFWLGEETTQDEMGTAAYKTVELDHYLKDQAIQHREVMSHESREFLVLFKESGLRYLNGGVESGFNHVEDEVSEPMLYHVKGLRRDALVIQQVKCRRDYMNSGDVFILDLGHTIYQWNGENSNPHEKLKAKALVDGIVSDRAGKAKAQTLDEGQGDGEVAEFWDNVPGERKIFGFTVKKYNVQGEEEGGDDDGVKAFRKVLFRLTDNDGDKLKFSRRARAKKDTGKINRKYLDTKDSFVLDDGFQVWVWVGRGASSREKGLAMSYAMKYLEEKKRPSCLPITRVKEGNEPDRFTEHFVLEDDNCCVIS